jgi:hypothetical protein
MSAIPDDEFSPLRFVIPSPCASIVKRGRFIEPHPCSAPAEQLAILVEEFGAVHPHPIRNKFRPAPLFLMRNIPCATYIVRRETIRTILRGTLLPNAVDECVQVVWPFFCTLGRNIWINGRRSLRYGDICRGRNDQRDYHRCRREPHIQILSWRQPVVIG